MTKGGEARTNRAPAALREENSGLPARQALG